MTDDRAKKAILARRQRFIAAAMLSTVLVGCERNESPRVCLSTNGDFSDPVQALQDLESRLQQDVDAAFQPIEDADAVLDSFANIGADLTAAKSKLDPKKLMVEVQKIIGGGAADLAGLELDDQSRPIVQDRIRKLEALVKCIEEVDVKATDLASRLSDAAPKVALFAAKGLARFQSKIKAPFGFSSEDKKKAEEDKARFVAKVDDFKVKAAEWQNRIVNAPAKGKDVAARLAKLR